jgi:hypothetical protein
VESEVSLAQHSLTAKSQLLLTWTFAMQRAVMLKMREPDTPGGFNNSMACKPASKSATAEDMTEMTTRECDQKLGSSIRRVRE